MVKLVPNQTLSSTRVYFCNRLFRKMIKQGLVSALLIAGALSKSKIAKTADGRFTKAPQVNQYDCQRGCIFENDDDYWCFLTSPPALRIGWEWE